MQIDEVINNMNIKMKFKILAFLIISFPTFQNYIQLQAILVGVIVPNHTCSHNNQKSNFSVSQDQCSINVKGSITKCKKWDFSPEPVGTTMISDYSLVCDKRGYGDFFFIVWVLSSLTGIVMGWLSDKYGRKRIVILNLTIETVSSLLLTATPNVITNMILRFSIGISASNVYIGFVWLMESVNVEFREVIGSFFYMYGCFAYMLFPLIVYLTKNWRYTQLISIIPSLLYLFIFFIPESPRWLFVMGKKNEAFRSLKSISKMNRIRCDFDQDCIVSEEEENKGNVWSALKEHTFIFYMALTMFLQFSMAILYFGVTTNISILSNNIFLSMFLLGLMEFPGLFFSYLSLHYLKRKFSLLTFGIIGSMLFFVTVFFNRSIFWQSVIRIIIGGIAKAFVSSNYQTVMVYIMECFPTSHRSLTFGCSQIFVAFSFLGAIYINKLSATDFYLPMTIYLVLTILSSLSSFFLLPETKDLPICETLHDHRLLRVGHEQEFLIHMRNKKSKEYSILKIDENEFDEDISLIENSK